MATILLPSLALPSAFWFNRPQTSQPSRQRSRSGGRADRLHPAPTGLVDVESEAVALALALETIDERRGRRGHTFEEVGFEEWWQVLPPGHHTIVGTLKLKRDVASPQLSNTRHIWLRLPSSYFHTDRRYPVIVMHDGQNLFDESTSFIGQEWHVDHTLLALEPRLEAIVVGVENLGGRRFHEYSPWISASQADDYLDFLAETVLPLVRFACHGRTLDGPEHTLIMGSSLGALISLYAFFQRRDVFGLCGAMSPPTWQGRLVPYLIERQHLGGTIYVDHGRKRKRHRGDNADAGCDGEAVRDALQGIGYRLDRDLHYRNDDGPHSESAWAARLPDALRLLFALDG